MKHKSRQGIPVTCWECKQGAHDRCLETARDMGVVTIHCHCSCQPACPRGCASIPAR